MYFVGIDISKSKHDCAVFDGIGDLIKPSRSFTNDREGFSALKDFLNILEREKKIQGFLPLTWYNIFLGITPRFGLYVFHRVV